MKAPHIHREVLPNGFRLVGINLPGRRSVTSFLAIRSGARYEDAANSGVAHFLEHLVFKGTAQYPTNAEVAQAIESIGGTLNAWTDFDHTAYWTIVPSASWSAGVELPFELAFAPRLRRTDIERERGVIIEEIRMLQDDPARYVHDLATELVFDGHPLSQPIIGTETTVTAMSSEQFTDYRSRFYVANHSVFVIVGDLTDGKMLEAVRERAAQLPGGELVSAERLSAPSRRQVRLLTKPTDQTHFLLATADPSLGLQSQDDRYTADVLNTILGRGMSSRLFLNVRESKGLAYSIHSHSGTLEDGGSISIYGGVNTEKAQQALLAVRDELRRLQEEPVTSDELANAQSYIVGSNDLRADQGMSLATWYGTDWLLGRWETHDEVATAIRRVTAADIQTLAQRIFDPNRLTLALIGPQTDETPFAKALAKQ